MQSRESLELFVDIDGKLHPALNLVSARLIAGRPDVGAGESQRGQQRPRGALVGIPGAPGRFSSPTSGIAVCGLRYRRPARHGNPGLHTAVIGSDKQTIISQDPSAARNAGTGWGDVAGLHGGQRHRLMSATTPG